MREVTVLLSTYNGEKYLAEQLDSLLTQKKVDFNVLVRDDMSSDTTLNILKEYANRDDRIQIMQESINIGAARSFLRLCSACNDSKYYAFCDQDDRWDESKLYSAVKMLDEASEKYGNIPMLYFSNMRVVDSKLNFMRYTYTDKRIPIQKTKYSPFVEVMASGNTYVFNESLRALIARKDPEFLSMHDSYIFPIASLFGKCIYDPEAHIDYRQHQNNQSGKRNKKKGLGHYLFRFRQLFSYTGESRYRNTRSIYECYKDIMTDADRTELEKIVNYKDSFGKKLALFFDHNIKGTTIPRDIAIRIKILAGNL